jgi:NADH dehydrogenase
VVIVGGGFGGLSLARKLAGAPVAVTLIDRTNHHLFQPLLYQVATAGLSPGDTAAPIRSVLKRQKNAMVLMAEILGADLARRVVRTTIGDVPFDDLVIATGARHSYFGHDEWEAFAPGLKTIEDARAIRERILRAFESAEAERDPARRETLLTFLIVGGGPTGVEMAGAIAELARRAIARDFRRIDPMATRIILIEAGPRVLSGEARREGAFSAPPARRRRPPEQQGECGRCGRRGLGRRTSRRFDRDLGGWSRRLSGGALARRGDGCRRQGQSRAGPERPGPPRDPRDRGRGARPFKGKPLPGVAPVAKQEGAFVAKVIRRRAEGRPAPAAFHYRDRGNLATVGRAFAVADFPRVGLSGFLAWLVWLFVHILYLIGFRNRVLVLVQWFWAYATWQRGVRLITAVPPRRP